MVRHDERGPFAGRLDLGAHRLERHDSELGQHRAEGERAAAAVERAVGDQAEVGEALAVVGEVVRGGVTGRRHAAVEEAVAEHRADAGVGQAGDRRVGVPRSVVAVREVEVRGDPGVECLDGAQPVAEVHVVGPVRR
jgi:hypothetical protein